MRRKVQRGRREEKWAEIRSSGSRCDAEVRKDLWTVLPFLAARSGYGGGTFHLFNLRLCRVAVHGLHK